MSKSDNRRRRASALVLVIVLSVVITGLVITMSWVATTQSNTTSSLSKVDQAYYAAEAGIYRVSWYLKNGKLGEITSPLTGTANGSSYSTSWTIVSDSTINIMSSGSLGSATYSLSVSVTGGPGSTAAMSTPGDFDAKNNLITGNVVVGGNFFDSGSGQIIGNLVYYGSASQVGDVSGTVTQASGTFSPIDMGTLGATLISSAGRVYAGNQNNKTFDFTSMSGTNKVIYVLGNVSNPKFIGSGTLYVTGTVTTDSFGSSADPVNLVASGDITTANNITMYGSLYTGGNWYRGKFAMTGLIYAKGIVVNSNNANSTLTISTVPWFDPRLQTSATPTKTTFSGFTGPQI